jgi:hypothetical protein
MSFVNSIKCMVTASEGSMKGEKQMGQYRQKTFLPQAVHTFSGVIQWNL